jgi:recombination protein RecA
MAKRKEEKSSIFNTIDSLRETYGKSLPTVDEAGVIHRLVLNSPKANYIFGGGYPLNRSIELYGSESSGKSVFSSYIGGQIQKRTDKEGQKIVLYIDSEHTFDRKYAENVGLDTNDDKFILIHPLNGEEAFTIMEDLTKTGEIGLIIFDSTSTIATRAAMEDDAGKSSFGGSAKMFSDGMKKLNPYMFRYDTPMIMLTQMRARIGAFGHQSKDAPSGCGYAPRFYASWRARLSKGEDILNGKEVIGNKITIKNTKSKIGYPKRSASLDLYYASGFNSDFEYIEFMIQLGLIEKKGGWYYSDEYGIKVQGVDKILPLLYEQSEKFEEAKKQVNGLFSTYNVLDEGETAEEEDDEEIPEEG